MFLALCTVRNPSGAFALCTVMNPSGAGMYHIGFTGKGSTNVAERSGSYRGYLESMNIDEAHQQVGMY